jgi:BolA protein
MLENHLRHKLEKEFAPEYLKVVNVSHKHKGHAGDDGSGETHFEVEITSSLFSGLSRIERQRLIYKLLSDEMANKIHALSISARAPGE